VQTEPSGASMASCAGRRIGGELQAKLQYNSASARVAASAAGTGSVLEHEGQGRGWPRATLSFYTVIDCHSLGIYTVILLSLLSFAVKMTVSPKARRGCGTCFML
jgi:hypothetical protein